MIDTKIDWNDDNMLSVEKWTWFELLSDFNLPTISTQWRKYGKGNFSNNKNIISLIKGDLLPISFGEYQDSDMMIKISLWTFSLDEKKISTIGVGPAFFKLNEIGSGGGLFRNITKSFIRNNNIEKILK